MSANPEAFGGRQGVMPRRQERFYRVKLINEILKSFALRLDDWQGQSFILSNRTGKTEIVDDLMAVWPAAEKMIGRQLDPTDPALLAHLRQQTMGH